MSVGNIGIGTTAPGFPLAVAGNASFTGNYIYNGSGTPQGYWYADSSNNVYGLPSTMGSFQFKDSAGTVKAVIAASGSSYFNSGNVGIGTTAPSQTLDLGGGTIAMGLQIRGEAVTIPSTTNATWSGYTTACTGTIAYVISAICWRGISTGSALPLRISGNQVAAFNGSGSTGVLYCTVVCANIR